MNKYKPRVYSRNFTVCWGRQLKYSSMAACNSFSYKIWWNSLLWRKCGGTVFYGEVIPKSSRLWDLAVLEITSKCIFTDCSFFSHKCTQTIDTKTWVFEHFVFHRLPGHRPKVSNVGALPGGSAFSRWECNLLPPTVSLPKPKLIHGKMGDGFRL